MKDLDELEKKIWDTFVDNDKGNMPSPTYNTFNSKKYRSKIDTILTNNNNIKNSDPKEK